MATDGTLRSKEIITADTPASGFRRLYAKVQGWFSLDSAGNEIKIDNALTGVAAGTDTYTVSISNASTSANLTEQKLFIKFTNANTGAATLNVNSIGAVAIKKNVSSALISGDILAGQIYLLIYDGTNFQIVGKNENNFVIELTSNSLSPADGATYYFAGQGGTIIVPTIVAADHAFTSPDFAFTIIGAIISAGINTTVGSTEESTLKLRNVTDATSTTIGNFRTDGSTTAIKNTTINNLNISVPASKSICMEWLAATWVTNPAGCRVSVQLICAKS